MVKKAKVYKPGDYVFAKVKGYPAWPAKIVSLNGKKYNIYFYGTGETANLPANDIFDYFEHKQKFLEKVLKRRDYNEGLAQIERETAELGLSSNDDVTGEAPDPSGEVDLDKTADTTVASESEADVSRVAKTPQKRAAEASEDDGPRPKVGKVDEAESDKEIAEPTDKNRPEKDGEEEEAVAEPAEGTPVVNTAKAAPKGRKSVNRTNSTPARTPRRSVKQEVMSPEYEPHVPAPESVSRSGRKIKPKRYLDEELNENQTAQTPNKKIKLSPATPAANSTVREDDDGGGASPRIEGSVAPDASAQNDGEVNVRKGRKKANKQILKSYNIIDANDVEKYLYNNDEEVQKDNVLAAVLPSGKIVGIKIDKTFPEHVSAETQETWKTQTVNNIMRLKNELENGQVEPSAILNQLEPDLGLSQDEIINMRKDRENEIKKRTVRLLKVEWKLVQTVKDIRGALGHDAANTELCIELLDEILGLDVTKVMLLKNVKVLETIQRARTYVGNLESWNLSEEETKKFKNDAEIINLKSEKCYEKFKSIFNAKDNEEFTDMFSHQLVVLNMLRDTMSSDNFIELVDEPPELLQNSTFKVESVGESKENVKRKTNNKDVNNEKTEDSELKNDKESEEKMDEEPSEVENQT